MSTENQIPPDDNVLEDSFNLDGVSLADIWLEHIHKTYDEIAEERNLQIEPITAFAPPRTDALLSISDRWYDHDRGIWILPETYHPAFALGVETADEVIETAITHHRKLRSLGMKLVGHMFEAINKDDTRFISHPQYKTIIAAGKYATRRRPSDVPQSDDDWLAARKLSSDFIEELELTDADLRESLLKPTEAYYDWCEDSDQAYVICGLDDFSSYVYHPADSAIVFEKISSKMGSVEEGNLYFARKRHDHFINQVLRSSGASA